MGTPRRVATMTAYDSIERGAADECKPLTGRRSRTFTLTHLLVACGAVCVCAIMATTVVNTHLANFDDESALANFDDGSTLDDGDSALANFDDGSALDDELALADSDDDSDDDFDDDDFPEEAQLGSFQARTKCFLEAKKQRYDAEKKVRKDYYDKIQGCKKEPSGPSRDKCFLEVKKKVSEDYAKVRKDYDDKSPGCHQLARGSPSRKKCFDEARAQASG